MECGDPEEMRLNPGYLSAPIHSLPPFATTNREYLGFKLYASHAMTLRLSSTVRASLLGGRHRFPAKSLQRSFRNLATLCHLSPHWLLGRQGDLSRRPYLANTASIPSTMASRAAAPPQLLKGYTAITASCPLTETCIKRLERQAHERGVEFVLRTIRHGTLKIVYRARFVILCAHQTEKFFALTDL